MTELLTITYTDNYEQSKKTTNGILSDIISKRIRDAALSIIIHSFTFAT